jgi:transcription elongation factor/antiterminator RfaH
MTPTPNPAAAEHPRNSFPVLGEGERWYVVHTLPFGEWRAQANIEHQGFRTFLPKRRKTIRHARKMRTVEAPFFPRYLFVALDLTYQQWRCINSSFGVSSLVMAGEQPQPVPHGIAEAFIAAADPRGILELGQHLKVGASVRLATGAFAEHLAILEALDDAGRVRILLDVLGRQIAVSTHSSNLLPLS